MAATYAQLIEKIRDIGRLREMEALLDWDQEVMMPAKGGEARGELLALMAGLRHQWLTDPEVRGLLAAQAAADDALAETNVREFKRELERAMRVPEALVRELAQHSSKSRGVWAKARKGNDFTAFAPCLEKMLELRVRQAEAIGYEEEPYDALLDEYEPGMRTREVADLFEQLRPRLAELVQQLADAPRQPRCEILNREFKREGQERVARSFADAMGFDFEAGRLDVSVHPFCEALSSRDVRLTTRYDEHFFNAAVFGVMHEAGHGLYEQGLEPEHRHTPMGQSVSLGIHESQSRFWENFVGRSRAFWDRRFAEVQAIFPESLRDVSVEDFHRAINAVSPSLIRVEADEVTYNLHIIVRFELERAMLRGELKVTELPDAWNERMERLVGVRPKDDSSGCLQDIHWAMGAFGYFPTYALGNLYAAQFHAAADKAFGGLDDLIRKGDLLPLREWLRTNIHRHGMRFRPKELVEHVTGAAPGVEPFMDYVTRKFRPLYGIA